MRRLIAGGTGFVGQNLARHWINQGVQVAILGRDKRKIQRCFGKAVDTITWEQFNTLPVSELKHFQTIVNLCGENIGEHRWSPARKRALIDSRIIPTTLIVDKLKTLGDQAPSLFNASAIGVYGLQQNQIGNLPEALDEEQFIDMHAYPDFLAEIARMWELATEPAKAHGVHVINLRFGVVLGHRGGALGKLITPIKWGLGGKIGCGWQPMSWIHLKDLLAIFDFLLEQPKLHGAVNCVAPSAVSQLQFAHCAASLLHRPCLFPLPAQVVKSVFGEMGECLLLQGQHVYPKRLHATDFHFQFGHLQEALGDLLK